MQKFLNKIFPLWSQAILRNTGLFSTLWDSGSNSNIFAGSASLAEVCALDMDSFYDERQINSIYGFNDILTQHTRQLQDYRIQWSLQQQNNYVGQQRNMRWKQT